MIDNKSRKHQVFYLLKYAFISRIKKSARRPLVCGFKITGDCNLNCLHCPFVGKKEDRADRLDYGSASSILDRLYDNGVRIIIFEGGEPLLWKDNGAGKDISDIITDAKKKFFFTCITTNGTVSFENINPDIVFISLDGLKETHEKIRGSGFDIIMSNIEKNAGKKKIIINICINRLNFMEIPELVKFIEGKVSGITIQFFYPYPEVENLSISSVQRKLVLGELIRLKKRGYGILDSYDCLKKMEDNSWKCRDFLIASVEADGRITHGCYLKDRVQDISCRDCGFAAHCEVSLAYDLRPGAIKAAKDIFWNSQPVP